MSGVSRIRVSLTACARAQDSPREKDDGNPLRPQRFGAASTRARSRSQPLARSSLLVQLDCSLRTSILLLRLLCRAARRSQAPTPSARTAPSAPSTPGGAQRNRRRQARASSFRARIRFVRLISLVDLAHSSIRYLFLRRLRGIIYDMQMRKKEISLASPSDISAQLELYKQGKEISSTEPFAYIR